MSCLARVCATGPVWSFGPFRLDAAGQALFDGEQRVRLGARAFGILLALVEQAGEMVPRDVLVARVWPGLFVDDSTLRVHVAALRKVLGYNEGERRYIVNIPGRGYVFAAPVQRLDMPGEAPTPARAAPSGLPPPLGRMIGRGETLHDLVARMGECRLLTIAGPGGMGKTTLALAVAGALAARGGGEAHFLDLAALPEQGQLPAAIARMLDVPWPSGELRDLVAALRGRRLLLVLDNCEHVVDAAAALAEALLAGLPELRLLATSREPLRAAGEWVHRLAPLGLPPGGGAMAGRPTAAEALAYPALQLFHERAAASLDGFTLGDAEAPLAAAICRRLEGIPLAIELAAAQLPFLGLAGLAAGLDDSLSALTRGRRAAVPRHRTLRATLDWSHALLEPREQVLLRRLSVFRGFFTLAAAQEVAGEPGAPRTAMMDGLASLAAKSLLAVDIGGDAPRYRLLAMTREHAAEKLAASGEEPAVAARHARHCAALLADLEADRAALPRHAWLAQYGGWIHDVRAALHRCFAPGGDAQTGITLAAVSAPLWFELSLVEELRDHAARALARLPGTPLEGGAVEMSLCLSAGLAMFETRGPGAELTALSTRALALAERHGSLPHQLRALWALVRESYALGEYQVTRRHCERFAAVMATMGEDVCAAMRDRMLGLGLQLVGRTVEALHFTTRSVERPARVIRLAHGSFHPHDNRVMARAHLARLLWMQGQPDTAAAVAEESVALALSLGYPSLLCDTLCFAAFPVACWNGDHAAAARHVALLVEHSADLGFRYWDSWRRLYEPVVAFGQAGPAERAALAARIRALPMSAAQADLLATFHPLLGTELARGRAAGEARSWCAPEVLRGEALALRQGGAEEAAEAMLRRALRIARAQGAPGWELRVVTSLAEPSPAVPRGAAQEALEALASLRARFTEGARTADLCRADALLAAG
ncbi:helix-turn-helix transcriptional regulator [Roseomonas sp. GC11]|uniref:ATP-binding protein n=1 Tax=Roseomonas sp. GC11 TaxID=2950546 RepID=UPI002109B7A3|nr:winged helix-turn-helix domain-containing protein [Roseomonas sp. GC11]MCQ4162989.1 helix-turn-helix transcriptional regulator [Roseomonas sp. GC11]